MRAHSFRAGGKENRRDSLRALFRLSRTRCKVPKFSWEPNVEHAQGDRCGANPWQRHRVPQHPVLAERQRQTSNCHCRQALDSEFALCNCTLRPRTVERRVDAPREAGVQRVETATKRIDGQTHNHEKSADDYTQSGVVFPAGLANIQKPNLREVIVRHASLLKALEILFLDLLDDTYKWTRDDVLTNNVVIESCNDINPIGACREKRVPRSDGRVATPGRTMNCNPLTATGGGLDCPVGVNRQGFVTEPLVVQECLTPENQKHRHHQRTGGNRVTTFQKG